MRLLVNGCQAAESRIERTVPLGFSADEGLDIGLDGGTRPLIPTRAPSRSTPPSRR
ncbi:arylsulfatase AtsD domain protein [Mycobacterium kansasii]|uniref:Arylsulfatase AtsD domain protein n=1 Tax=Mycobacterium kansasii TaxID=1768 RepID=A0A1V3XCT7_MYCKA|nr:arylsulfatase AtsD domain protein [Mycobacterium kansasii]